MILVLIVYSWKSSAVLKEQNLEAIVQMVQELESCMKHVLVVTIFLHCRTSVDFEEICNQDDFTILYEGDVLLHNPIYPFS